MPGLRRLRLHRSALRGMRQDGWTDDDTLEEPNHNQHDHDDVGV